jgi:glucokinase
MSVPEVGLMGDIGATNARFALVQADASMGDLQIPSLLSRRGINNHVRDGSHQVLRWFMKRTLGGRSYDNATK